MLSEVFLNRGCRSRRLFVLGFRSLRVLSALVPTHDAGGCERESGVGKARVFEGSVASGAVSWRRNAE